MSNENDQPKAMPQEVYEECLTALEFLMETFTNPDYIQVKHDEEVTE